MFQKRFEDDEKEIRLDGAFMDLKECVNMGVVTVKLELNLVNDYVLVVLSVTIR